MGLGLEFEHAVVDLLKRCAEMALHVRADMRPELKQDGSIVTRADRDIESFLRVELPKLLPGSTVWGEEFGYEPSGPAGLWALDPIDGTSNYRFGSPLWGISLGLIQDGVVTMGVINLPDLNRIYSATRDLGARRNGIRLGDIRPGEIDATELVSLSDDTLLEFGHRVPGKMRYAGAFVVEAAFFADQVFRAMISNKAALYDAAASFCIAREVGAQVRYLDGAPMLESEVMGGGRFPKSIALLPPGCSLKLD